MASEAKQMLGVVQDAVDSVVLSAEQSDDAASALVETLKLIAMDSGELSEILESLVRRENSD